MKTTYLTILFLLLGIMLSGCGNTGEVLLTSDANSSFLQKTDSDNTDETIINDSTSEEADEYIYSAQPDTSACSDSDKEGNDKRASDDIESDNVCDRIYVFVCGHVASPGVYELEQGSRICDALALAGGITEDGVFEALNQASVVSDGQTIYVPGNDEQWERSTQSGDVLSSGNVAAGNDIKGKDDLASKGLININTATKEELMGLPGIGEAKATVIIDYRNEHGSFKSIDELKNIQGIKEGVFNKVKDLITI